jgi:hypothetical protein
MSLTIGFLKGWYEIYQIYIKREEKQKFWHEALVRRQIPTLGIGRSRGTMSFNLMFYFEKHFY